LVAFALTAYSDLDQMRSKLIKLGYDVPRKRYGFADEGQEETEESNATQEPPVNDKARGKSAVLALSANTKRRRLYATGLTHIQQSTKSTDLHLHRGNGNGISAKRTSTIRTNKSFATRSA
jgi:hypothetical protein